MVNWLLPLAVYSLVASVAAIQPYCMDALSSWTFNDFKNCRLDPIRLENGNGTVDLSTWSDNELIEIFSRKAIYGGFIISNSQITGEGVYFTVGLTEDGAKIVIENNLKLEEMLIERSSESPLYIRVSGNRQLEKKYIIALNDLKDNHEIRSDSYIQAYQECNLNGVTIKDVKSELANCSAIYGDLVFDANTIFPQTENEWKSIEPLEYVEGCLRIIGTGLSNWEDIAFLKKTTALKGCKTGHEISGNEKMCIQPDLAHNLKGIFSNMVITGNQKCTPECSSGYLHDTGDKSCVIIAGPLIINENTTESVLKALATVEEIRGNLQMTNTNITDFNYLPKLTKLNTGKIESGPVINIQWNHQLKSFDLPSLNETGLIVGRDGQLKYQDDNNDYYKTDPAFLKRIGANEKDSMILTNPPTTPATTTATRATEQTEKPIELISFLEALSGYLFAAAAIFVIALLLVVLLVLGCCFKWWQRPKKWHWYPMGDAIEQTDIYNYDKESDWHKEAKELIEKHKPDIEKNNLKHKNNRDYKKLTCYNYMASVMPGLWQQEDYKMKVRKQTEKETEGKRVNRQSEELKNINKNTLNYPAGEDGVYGLAFQAKIASQPDKKNRNQCDEFGYRWFELDLPPVYPEYFESTAKLMAKLPCDMIGEKIEYMKDKGIPIEEFGLVGKEFKAAVTVDGKDPVPSRAKNEKEDHFWLRDQMPQFKMHRYGEKLNSLGIKGWKYSCFYSKNLDKFVCRLVEALMNLPTNNNLDLKASDVDHFLKVIQPRLFGEKEKNKKKGYPRATMSAGESVAILNKTHVRIVGEIRGDFDALRRAINIPSLLGGKDHPMLQYNWVFLGNYTGRHPQSLETIMFLLALQFLYGRDCIVLLRGIMEFKNTSEKYGFKDNLMGRFGEKDGLAVWEKLMKAMSQLPLNCKVLYGAYCSSGGFTEDDIESVKEEKAAGSKQVKKEGSDDAKEAKKEKSGGPEEATKRDAAGKDKKTKKNASSATSTASTGGTPVTKAPVGNKSRDHESTTPQELAKLFSMPNVTVRDYLENADTGAGYYYGERVLEKIARDTEMYTFFSTLPMSGGVGFFSDTSAVQLITISSVRHLHGHGGQKTLLAAVAEINGDTDLITLHMILHEDEMFYYDPKTGKLEEKKKGKKRTSSITSPISKESAPSTSSTGNSASKIQIESTIKEQV